MNTRITVTTIINADITKVWDYYTKPTHIINWNFADPSWHCPNATNDMMVGGTYKARMEAKDGSFGFDFEAIYTDIIYSKEFTYSFDGRIANVKFIERDKGTELTIEFDPETENPFDLQKSGWQAILDNFKEYTEQN